MGRLLAMMTAAALCACGHKSDKIRALRWTMLGDGDIPLTIDDTGTIRDECGALGRLDGARGTVELTRSSPQSVKVRDLLREKGNQFVVGGMGPFEMQNGKLTEGGVDVAGLDGYDDGTAARTSFVALIAAGTEPCYPPVALVLDGSDHHFAIEIGGAIRDGDHVVASVQDSLVVAPDGTQLARFRGDLSARCIEVQVRNGPYAEQGKAAVELEDDRLRVVNGPPLGLVRGRHATPRSLRSLAALAAYVVATLPAGAPGTPGPASSTCPVSPA
jgi:hypothetical protein